MIGGGEYLEDDGEGLSGAKRKVKHEQEDLYGEEEDLNCNGKT